jgi:hypothetical protein
VSGKEPGFVVGASNVVYPIIDALKEWAELRKLSLDDADVLGWQDNA